jgi:hypothetical protein
MQMMGNMHARTKTRSKFRVAVVIGFILAALPLCLVCYRAAQSATSDLHSEDSTLQATNNDSFNSLAQPQQGTAKSDRPVYPYSVIPGGVKNPQEVAGAMKRDPTVAEHLKGFDLQKARVVKVDAPRAVYVSYRKGNQIHWTSKKMMLSAGEILITDGNRTIRGRCGNDVSSEAVAEPAEVEDEPDMRELDTPLIVGDPNDIFAPMIEKDRSQPDLDPSWFSPVVPPPPPGGPPNVAPPSGPYSPVIPPAGGWPATPNTTGDDPPASAPEPPTLLMIGIGSAVIGAKQWWMRFRAAAGPRC